MMKKTLLSLAALATLGSAANAAAITLYQDTETGAIYTKPGANRVELGDFVSAKEQYIEKQTMLSKINKKLGVKVKSGVPTLKFSGKHYLGYTYTDDQTSANNDKSAFETRRNYFQVKAYWNKKDYMRITLDTFQNTSDVGSVNFDDNTTSSSKDAGSWEVRLKYAYIYLDNILPYTGVEFGQAHRPWIDWEEHHGWLYRSIAKTFVEEHDGAHLTNSADLGINFKTKTDYFSSEIGLYNGEGYHTVQDGTGMSFEWRLTANILGTGKKHVHATEDEYLDISFLGQLNNEYKGGEDLNWYGVHAVYNQPMFLVAGMYCSADNNNASKEGDGYTINAEFRPAHKWSILGRYDNWTDKSDNNNIDRTEIIAGVAYKYNKNVKFIANIFDINKDSEDIETKYMFTTEVKW